MNGLKLRAQITIDLDAVDLAEAAGHQARLEELLAPCRAAYGQMQLRLAQRRPRDAGPRPPRAARHFTGALSRYEDDPT